KLTQQGMVLGTPPYMSPEQFTGKELDLRSDIYSLGVLAYEMLTGKLPFDADTPWEWATKHMTAQPTPFDASPQSMSAPQGMRVAIMRALSKDRDERQASAGEFFSDLSGGGGLTVEQKPISADKDLGSAGTAEMAAAPDFAAMGAAPMGGPPVGGPAMGGMGGSPMGAPMGGGAMGGGPMGGGPMVAALPPPPPPAQASGGGNKGLMIGLAALLGVLGLAIVGVVIAKSGGDDGPSGIDLGGVDAGGPTSGADATVVQPETTGGGNSSGGSGSGSAGGGGTEPDSTATAQPTATSKPTATAQPTATAKPTATSNAAACDQCIASAGNPAAAANYYRSCTDAGKKAA